MSTIHRLINPVLLAASALACLPGTALSQQAPSAVGTVTTGIPGVVASGAAIELIKEGFSGTEGPVALPDGSFAFTETQAARITRIAPDGAISTLLENTNGANGLGFGAHGELYAVQVLQPRVGIIHPPERANLLREGLDVPEVSLVAILDADKEGFLRSERSLVQTIGRAARNSEGKVIMYGDKVTDSMQRAMDETSRRRSIQQQYNEEHGIVPKTIIKEIRDLISISKVVEDTETYDTTSFEDLSKSERKELIARMEEEMREAAKTLDFETAATLRDTILELKAAE